MLHLHPVPAGAGFHGGEADHLVAGVECLLEANPIAVPWLKPIEPALEQSRDPLEFAWQPAGLPAREVNGYIAQRPLASVAGDVRGERLL